MRTSEMIKSKYFRANDVQGVAPFVLTIAHVTEELMGRPGTRQDTKCFLWFQEHVKGLQLNKTRVRTLEAAYGPDSELWTGKRVRLSFDPTVEFGGRAVGGVRLQTPPGAVYDASQTAAGAWGAAPGPTPAANVPGRPPPPVWDDQRQMWIVPEAPSQAKRPPPPVYNEKTGEWEMVNPQTGEIAHTSGARAAPPAPNGHQRPPTISERVNAGHPPMKVGGDEWGNSENPAPPGAAEDFNDDIPF